MCELQRSITPPRSLPSSPSTLHPHIKGEAPSTKGWMHPHTESQRLRREARVKKKTTTQKHFKGENDNTMLGRFPKKISNADILTQKNTNENITLLTCTGVMLLSTFTGWKNFHLKHLKSLKHRIRHEPNLCLENTRKPFGETTPLPAGYLRECHIYWCTWNVLSLR